MRLLRRQLRVACAVAAILMLAPWSHASDKIRVAVLMSDSLTATMRTLSGARKAISREHPETGYRSFLINPNADHADIVDSLTDFDPTLLLTIGSSCTRFAQDYFTKTPIVFAAVMYPVVSGFVKSRRHPGANITGAALDIPIDVQFKYFRKIIPKLKNIGLLYTDSTASLIPPARERAKELGFNLMAVRVASSKELPQALDSLAAAVDGIWSLADPILFAPRSTRYILLNTLRKGIPFMGFSRNVVESGALFALDFDYKAVGRQAGITAASIISGRQPGNIHVTTADVIWFHYNEKTARHINVTIPEELAAVAKEVYR